MSEFSGLFGHRPGEGDFHNRSITLATLALRTSVPRDDRIARLPAAAALNSVLDTSWTAHRTTCGLAHRWIQAQPDPHRQIAPLPTFEMPSHTSRLH